MNRKRLSIEAWRDMVLAVSGELDTTMGGKSFVSPADPSERRRTIYSEVSRLEVNRMLALFDFPDPNSHAPRRVETTTALQKLFVMNNPFLIHHADKLAERIAAEAQDNNAARVQLAYALLFNREPTPRELELAQNFIGAHSDTKQAWREYAQALMASNEALFID
jgi:hypothetical protein